MVTETTGFPARPLAKALAFAMALTACQSSSHLRPSEDAPPLRVTSITKASPDPESSDAGRFPGACADWTLTAAQVETFFRLSDRYPTSPYSRFYQLPCTVTGTLEADGKTWEFEINGGGTAVWRAGGTVRYWGCSAPACSQLVLLPTDLIQPDAAP